MSLSFQLKTFTLKRKQIDPDLFLKTLKSSLRKLDLSGNAFTSNQITIHCLWAIKVISYFENLETLSKIEREQVSTYVVRNSSNDMGFFWRMSFSVIREKARKNYKISVTKKVFYFFIRKFVTSPFFKFYIAFHCLVSRGGVFLISRDTGQFLNSINLTALIAADVQHKPVFITIKKNYCIHNSTLWGPEKASLQNVFIDAFCRSLLNATMTSVGSQALLKKTIRSLLPNALCEVPKQSDLFSNFFQNRIKGVLNFGGDILINQFLYEIVMNSKRCGFWGLQHGGGYKEIDSFTITGEIKSYAERHYLFASYDLKAWQSKLNKPGLKHKNLMGFVGCKGVLYPVSPENKNVESGATDAKTLFQISNGRFQLVESLKYSNMPIWIKGHPKSDKSSWSSIPSKNLFSYGVKPKIEKKSVLLVVFDAPGSSLMLDCLNQGIPFICVFNAKDYTLSRFGNLFFETLRQKGLLWCPTELKKDSFSKENIEKLIGKFRGPFDEFE